MPSDPTDFASALDSGSTFLWTSRVEGDANATVSAVGDNDTFPDGDGVLFFISGPIWQPPHSPPVSASLTTTVQGSGTLRWWWKFVQGIGGSSFVCHIDGVRLSAPAGSGGSATYEITGATPHTLSWVLSAPTTSSPHDMSQGYLDHVMWKPFNQPPVADAGLSQTVMVQSTVRLDGSKSSDPDGDPITYAWTVTARPLHSGAWLAGGATAQPTLTPDKEGVYRVQLVVTDKHGLRSAPATVTVTAVTKLPWGPA